MSYNYKKTYTPAIGYTKLCEMDKCSCKRLEFGMIELNAGDSVTIETEGKEYSFIFLFGHADVKVGDNDWKAVGGRMDVFEGPAHSIYVPRNSTVTFTGCDHVKIGVIDTPTDKDSQAQWQTPDKVKVMTLGETPWKRDAHIIVDGDIIRPAVVMGTIPFDSIISFNDIYRICQQANRQCNAGDNRYQHHPKRRFFVAES